MRFGAPLLATALIGIAAGPYERPAPADLVLTLAGPRTVELYSTAQFVISVRNEIPGSDVQPRVTVRLPAGISYVAPVGGTVPCSGRAGTVVCQVRKLPASFAFPVQAARPGRAALEAVAEADVQDVRPENNTDRATVDAYGLELRLLRVTPSRPRRGRRFVASATLFRSGTRTAVRVQARSASCPGGVTRTVVGSGPSLPGRPTVDGARVSCAWLIPARPRGRFFRGAVIVRRRSGFTPKISFWRELR